MLGRFGHFLIGGAALFAGMLVQGDLDLGSDDHDRSVHRAVDRAVDRSVDRTIDRATDRIEVRTGNGTIVNSDAATERALAAAIAELVRAQGSLITARMDDDLPASVVEQVEQRRDAAREAVERIADQARAESRRDRDSQRHEIRDEIRAAVRG